MENDAGALAIAAPLRYCGKRERGREHMHTVSGPWPSRRPEPRWVRFFGEKEDEETIRAHRAHTEERVRRGIAFLEERGIDWRRAIIEASDFDMSHGEKCVLALVSSMKTYSKAIMEFRIPPGLPYACGFCEYHARRYPLLTEVWTSRVFDG